MVIVSTLFFVYKIMMFIRVLGSWVPELQQWQFMRFIAFYTDPYFNFFRKFIPPLGMIDISPLVAFFCLIYLIEPFTKSTAALVLSFALHR